MKGIKGIVQGGGEEAVDVATEADAPLHLWLREHGMDPESTGIDGIQGEGVLTAKSPGRENYGRLQGDVGHLAWSTAGAVGGYSRAGLGREELEAMTGIGSQIWRWRYNTRGSSLFSSLWFCARPPSKRPRPIRVFCSGDQTLSSKMATISL